MRVLSPKNSGVTHLVSGGESLLHLLDGMLQILHLENSQIIFWFPKKCMRRLQKGCGIPSLTYCNIQKVLFQECVTRFSTFHFCSSILDFALFFLNISNSPKSVYVNDGTIMIRGQIVWWIDMQLRPVLVPLFCCPAATKALNCSFR